jgi:hypothetical protein
MADISLDDVVRRNCDALVTGNIAQIFADLTPQAMAKLSQSAGAQMGGAMPKLTSYQIVGQDEQGDDQVYDVRFSGDVNFGIKAHWRQLDGQWKIVDFEPYEWSSETDGAGPRAAG